MLTDLDLLMIDNATDAGRDVRPGRAQRRDGWTPERIRIFLRTLARRGVVAEAARAAGISAKSAYALRNGAKGAAFARAWAMAGSAARRVAGRVTSRVRDGIVVPIVRRGKVWGLRRRPDNPYTMRVLRNLDRAAKKQPPNEALLRLAENFDAFVDYVADRCGTQPAAA
jgi:hypothetical protein